MVPHITAEDKEDHLSHSLLHRSRGLPMGDIPEHDPHRPRSTGRARSAIELARAAADMDDESVDR